MPNVESNLPREPKGGDSFPLLNQLRILFDTDYFVPNAQRASQYLCSDHSKNRSSGDVLIPIGKKELVHYFGNVKGGTSDRPISSYQEMLFPDVFQKKAYTPDGTYSIKKFLEEAIHQSDPDPVFNGYDGVFTPGSTVLDIASGEAIAAIQLALTFPQTTIIGVDLLYQTKRKVYPNKPGLQLTHADWRHLESIPSASVDTILSCQGVSMWGLPFEGNSEWGGNDIPESDGLAIVNALNRVSKPGTILRLDYNNNTFLYKHLKKNWTISSREDVFVAQRQK